MWRLALSLLFIFQLTARTASAESDGCIKSGKFVLTKGMKCGGGFEKEKGGGKMCEGAVKVEFDASTKAQDIADIVAPELHDQIHGIWPSHDGHDQIEDLNDDVFKSMIAFDEQSLESVASLEGDSEKKVEFGGFRTLFWSCNVTIADTPDGAFKKVVECGVKGSKGMGKKPTVQDEYAQIYHEQM